MRQRLLALLLAVSPLACGEQRQQQSDPRHNRSDDSPPVIKQKQTKLVQTKWGLVTAEDARILQEAADRRNSQVGAVTPPQAAVVSQHAPEHQPEGKMKSFNAGTGR